MFFLLGSKRKYEVRFLAKTNFFVEKGVFFIVVFFPRGLIRYDSFGSVPGSGSYLSVIRTVRYGTGTEILLQNGNCSTGVPISTIK